MKMKVLRLKKRKRGKGFKKRMFKPQKCFKNFRKFKQ